MALRAKKSAYYSLKVPNTTHAAGKRKGKRNSFALIRQTKLEDGRLKTETVHDLRIDVINRRFASGEAPFIESLEQIQEIKAEYEKQVDIIPAVNIHNADNLRIFQTLWNDDYQYRDINSARSRMVEFARIFELLGHESIITLAMPDLQQKINFHCGDDVNKQRRMVDTANQILKFLFSRGFANPTTKLKKKKKKRKVIKHLSLEEFKAVLSYVKDQTYIDMYQSAFSSGCRLGELLFITSDKFKVESFGTGLLLVDGQIVKVEEPCESEFAPTAYRAAIQEKDTLKNRTERRLAFVIEFGIEPLKRWSAIPLDVKKSIRGKKYGAALKEACKQTFPDNPDKHLAFHDLRHSYAIHLLRLGMSMEDVARSIGDTVEVCEEFYAGFSHTPETVMSMAERYIKLIEQAANKK